MFRQSRLFRLCLLFLRVMGGLRSRLSRLDRAFARGGGQDVHHNAHGQHTVQDEGDDRAQHGAQRARGLGHGHHERDIGPCDDDQVHCFCIFDERGCVTRDQAVALCMSVGNNETDSPESSATVSDPTTEERA